jgi:hypothetical protein
MYQLSQLSLKTFPKGFGLKIRNSAVRYIFLVLSSIYELSDISELSFIGEQKKNTQEVSPLCTHTTVPMLQESRSGCSQY